VHSELDKHELEDKEVADLEDNIASPNKDLSLSNFSQMQNQHSNSVGSCDFFSGIDFRNALRLNSLDDIDIKNFRILHEANGDIYEGEVVMMNEQLTKHGVGKLITKTGNIFEGFWKNNQIEGICKIRYNNGDIYEGQFSNGKQNGVGVKFIISSGERYEGQWVNGQMTGYGKYFFNGDE
jgi:hypothetical protein